MKQVRIMRHTSSYSSANEITSHVSLAGPPWGSLDIVDRSDTAPSGRTIRGAHKWYDDPKLKFATSKRITG